MASLELRPDGLAVRLGKWERFGTFQRDFTVPWEHVDKVDVITDMWPHLQGWRAPGIGIPHVIVVGRMRYRGGKDFCAVHHGQPGLILELHDEPYRRLVLSTPPEVAHEVYARVTGG